MSTESSRMEEWPSVSPERHRVTVSKPWEGHDRLPPTRARRMPGLHVSLSRDTALRQNGIARKNALASAVVA